MGSGDDGEDGDDDGDMARERRDSANNFMMSTAFNNAKKLGKPFKYILGRGRRYSSNLSQRSSPKNSNPSNPNKRSKQRVRKHSGGSSKGLGLGWLGDFDNSIFTGGNHGNLSSKRMAAGRAEDVLSDESESSSSSRQSTMAIRTDTAISLRIGNAEVACRPGVVSIPVLEY